MNSPSITRPAITKLLIGAVVLLGLLGLFVALAGSASAGGDTKITVNSTANIDDGECEGAPNDDEIGNCTLREAINMVNNGDADIINFHKPVFSKEQPGVINLCEDDSEGTLPEIRRDVVIDSKNSGVILDGGDKNEDCENEAHWGILVAPNSNGLDFELNGGKNFEVRNICGKLGAGIRVDGFWDTDIPHSLGNITITGVTVENVCGHAVNIQGPNLEKGAVTNSEVSSPLNMGVLVLVDACSDEKNADEDKPCPLDDSTLEISGNRIQGGTNFPDACCPADGVQITYVGQLNSGHKITTSVSGNEVINGTDNGVDYAFFGCGQESGINVHVDNNEEINGGTLDGVNIDILADKCKAGTDCFNFFFDGLGAGQDTPCACPNGIFGGAGGSPCPCPGGLAGDCGPGCSGRTFGVAGGCEPCPFGLSVAGECSCPDGVIGGNGTPCECPDPFNNLGGFANPCECPEGLVMVAGIFGPPICVEEGETSEGLDIVVTVNGNGDIETQGLVNAVGTVAGSEGLSANGVDIGIYTCCEESDSSATVEVNDNGRITGEFDGVQIDTQICCGDDNSTDTSVNRNDEITGEGDDGIDVESLAGSVLFLPFPSCAGGGCEPVEAVELDADDNVCAITIDGNNEIDGVGDDGASARCFAGTLGVQLFDLEFFFPGEGGTSAGAVKGPALSSGDGNTSTVTVTNNNDIDGDDEGVLIRAGAGSLAGEADDNLASATISGNGEITGDDDDGIDVEVGAGTQVEEGDDNATEIVIEENAEVGGNGGDGMDLDSFAGGITAGSEDNSTAVTIVQNGDIEGSGSSDDGIDIRSSVCCDPDNVNTIDILNNKGEITGHDEDGIDIATCCSVNIITIMDNEGNIRGGDDHGLRLEVCDIGLQTLPGFVSPRLSFAGDHPVTFRECLKDSITHLTVINNSFSDSEKDGIHIRGGTFEDEEREIKSVISKNIIEGNGDDGIDIDSANGLNIGPANEIFENGTGDGDSGIEIDWALAGCEWANGEGNKFPANHNRITQNLIWDNFDLGIDLVGWAEDADELDPCLRDGGRTEGEIGCDIFPDTPIAANDCLPFPELKTQSGDKIIGNSCSLCFIELFWADNDPANDEDEDGNPHGEGVQVVAKGEADEDGSFSIDLPCDLGPGDLTATATDKLKNTSEFSANLVTLGTSSCATDTPLPTDTLVPTNTPAVTDTPVPTNTPVPTSTPVPPKVCGDVNMDGVANSVDASLVLQFKAGLISSLPNESSGDVNGDGALTSVDAALLLQFTAGLIDEDALTC